MKKTILLTTLLLAACGPSDRVKELQAALDQARYTLAESADIAESDVEGSKAVEAELRIDAEPVFAVGAFASRLHDVRIDIRSGLVLGLTDTGGRADVCDGGISLAEAIRIAEKEVGGRAVSIEPDDDGGGCQREVEVLEGDMLWEVEVDGRGRVTETEEGDDEGDDD